MGIKLVIFLAFHYIGDEVGFELHFEHLFTTFAEYVALSGIGRAHC